jgi:hypothetical protein
MSASPGLSVDSLIEGNGPTPTTASLTPNPLEDWGEDHRQEGEDGRSPLNDISASSESSFDSLFDETQEIPTASRSTPPIPGLWVFPGLLSPEAAGASYPNLNVAGC